MKTLEEQNKKAVFMVFCLGFTAICLSFLNGCCKQIFVGPQGPQGSQGNGSGILVTKATNCPNGGINLETFIDPYNTGVYVTGDVITSLSTICNGTNGANGNNLQINQTLANSNECSNGGVVYTTYETDSTGNTLPNTTNQAIICNGQQGLTGAQGPAAPFSTITPIEPCGANSSPWKEVLLCLDNGNVLGDFSQNINGQDTRLSFILTGTYEDTDESGCVFNVNVDSNNDTIVSWNSGNNQYSTWDTGSITCINNE